MTLNQFLKNNKDHLQYAYYPENENPYLRQKVIVRFWNGQEALAKKLTYLFKKVVHFPYYIECKKTARTSHGAHFTSQRVSSFFYVILPHIYYE